MVFFLLIVGTGCASWIRISIIKGAIRLVSCLLVMDIDIDMITSRTSRIIVVTTVLLFRRRDGGQYHAGRLSFLSAI